MWHLESTESVFCTGGAHDVLSDSVVDWGIVALAPRTEMLSASPHPHPPLVSQPVPPGRACQQLPIFWTKNAFWQDVNLRQTSQWDAFCDTWKALKFVFGRSSAADPARGSSGGSPESVVGLTRLGRRNLLPHSPSFHAFRVFGSALLAPRTSMPSASSLPHLTLDR